MKGGLMVCGTHSDAGKSVVVAGLCRLLARRGVAVAPFKAQNMALNSAVTAAGHEIGRAQAMQARAAGVEPEVAMNPVLLKPTSERSSQLVVMGRPTAVMDAAAYHAHKPTLMPVVLAALADLRTRFDVVIAEGAGSPAEINLLDHDLVNLRLAKEAGMAAIVVGDIDRGGVFASLYGTVALLPDDLRPLVRGFVINKLRGDPSLLGDGPAELERRCGVPTLGVLPMAAGLHLDAEDSLALDGGGPAPRPALADPLDVAVVRFPRISNFTDLDPLALEPGVTVRFVTTPQALGDADLVVLPGSKATVDDLAWLRTQGFEAALRSTRALVLGVCGGYQMLGRVLHDDVESGAGRVDGLGLLDVETRFEADKVTARRRGTAMGADIAGYQIHHGRVHRGTGAAGWLHLTNTNTDTDTGTPLTTTAALPTTAAEGIGFTERGCIEDEGAVDLSDARILGTTLHGLFDSDDFRKVFLTEVGRRAGKAFLPDPTVSFAAARESQLDGLADLLERHIDLARLLPLIEST